MSLVRVVAATACALLLACTQNPTIVSQSYTQGRESRELDVKWVAIAPFTTGQLYRGSSARDMKGPEATALVERFVSEALEARGVRVVPAGDVRTALRVPEGVAMPPPGVVTKVAHQEFGVPYVVYGTVYRMRNRDASVMSERGAASVWFEVSVVKAPGAGRVWDASFNETQRPLNQNLFNAPRYPGGGTRWLSAEELAQWGARELAADFPTGPPETRGRR